MHLEVPLYHLCLVTLDAPGFDVQTMLPKWEAVVVIKPSQLAVASPHYRQLR